MNKSNKPKVVFVQVSDGVFWDLPLKETHLYPSNHLCGHKQTREQPQSQGFIVDLEIWHTCDCFTTYQTGTPFLMPRCRCQLLLWGWFSVPSPGLQSSGAAKALDLSPAYCPSKHKCWRSSPSQLLSEPNTEYLLHC